MGTSLRWRISGRAVYAARARVGPAGAKGWLRVSMCQIGPGHAAGDVDLGDPGAALCAQAALVVQIDRRIQALEQAIDLLAKDGPHSELIARLRCMRGIDTLTAIGLVAEVGDFHRFKSAEQFMSFTGLVPPSAPPARAAGRARSPRPAPRTPEGCWSKPRGTAGAGRPSATSSSAARPTRTLRCSSTPGAPSSDCTAAGNG
jgi:hypothetical protein